MDKAGILDQCKTHDVCGPETGSSLFVRRVAVYGFIEIVHVEFDFTIAVRGIF